MSDLFEAIRNSSVEDVRRLISPETIEERLSQWCERPLNLACRKGDLEIVAAIVASGADVNAKDGCFGNTALHAAIDPDHEGLARAILQSRLTMCARDLKQQTPRHGDIQKSRNNVLPLHNRDRSILRAECLMNAGACAHCFPYFIPRFDLFAASYGSIEIVKLLIEGGANVTVRNRLGFTPLYLALIGRDINNSSVELVKVLLKSGAEVNPQDFGGIWSIGSPLHQAAGWGKHEVVELLIQAGANVAALNTFGETPLHCGRTSSVATLLLNSGADVDAQDCNNRTPLLTICSGIGSDVLGTVRVLVDAGADVNILLPCMELPRFCHLHVGALRGDRESCSLLSTLSTEDQSSASTTKATPLHAAAFISIEDVAQLFLASLTGDRESRFQLSAPSTEENTRKDVVQLLLESGAVQLCSDPFDLTPLHLAVVRSHKQTVELLLEGSADPCVNVKNSDGFTALHLAAYLGLIDIVEVLLHHNADVNLSSRLTGIGLNVKVINEKRDCLDRQHENLSTEIEATPLHMAAYKGHEKVVKLLLENGADPGLRTDPHYLTPLHMAAARGFKTTVDVLLDDANPCVDAVTSEGLTALHLAAYYGYTKIVEVLLNHNANVYVVCNSGRTPLYTACLPFSGRDRDPIITALLEQGLEFTREIYDFCRSSKKKFNSNVFERHYIKMITAGLCPPQSDKSLSILPFCVKLTGWERYRRKCEREVALMRSTQIDNTRFTYYNLLKNSARVSLNETAAHTLKAQDLKESFVIYGSLLSFSFQNSLRRRQLLEQCYPIFSTIFSAYEPPVEIIDEVCSYLTNHDLWMCTLSLHPNNFAVDNRC